MAFTLDRKLVKEKAAELAFAARAVIQQLASKDRTPEGLAAQDILEKALMGAIPDSASPAAPVHQLAGR